MKILIIEDNLDVAESIAMILHEHEITVVHTRNDALERIKVETPDLILMDLSMPGMSPEVFLRNIRLEKIETPVILMTAGYNPRRIAEDLGLKHSIGKPFNCQELIAEIALCGRPDGSVTA